MNPTDPHRIETLEQLRAVIDAPAPALESKLFEHIDEYARAFIERSPLLLLATSDAEGRQDVSPKGDAPGFVTHEDERTLLLPDRVGNKLAYGFSNLLQNPRVGLVFLVPGVTETLRVNGRAEITRDPALLERLSAKGKPAVLVTRVHVEEAFFHCGKAFIRSSLWKPESWPEGYKVRLGNQLATKLGGDDALAQQIDEGLEQSYRDNLY